MPKKRDSASVIIGHEIDAWAKFADSLGICDHIMNRNMAYAFKAGFRAGCAALAKETRRALVRAKKGGKR